MTTLLVSGISNRSTVTQVEVRSLSLQPWTYVCLDWSERSADMRIIMRLRCLDAVILRSPMVIISSSQSAAVTTYWRTALMT
jgi:hypothetical protein